MPLLEGGTLADPQNRRAFGDPARALALMVDIAGAVQLAHKHTILHCDLTPENILLDSARVPRVSDFGLARAIDKAGRAHVHGGKAGWMSPEQQAGGPLTTGSDVFSLGVMLRWLLRPSTDDGGRIRRRSDATMLAWDLGMIADRAADPEPQRRYQTAAEMAGELERARDDYPIDADRARPFRRARKWIRRHRLVTVIGVQALLLLLYFALMPVSVLREVRNTIRQRNEFAALTQAGAVMNELRSFAAQIETMAATREIRELVNHPDVYAPPAALAERIGGFDSIAVFQLKERKCIVRARYPRTNAAYVSRDFSFRDYVQTLEQLADSPPGAPLRAYVSRVFRSQPDGRLFIGFASPLLDDEGRPVGVVLGSTLARATFGAVQMNCTGGGDCMTALLGSRDRDSPGEPLPDKVNVLAEPGLVEGEDRTLDAATSTRVCRTLGCVPRLRDQFVLPPNQPPLVIDDYRDPLSRRPSMAAMAPVGGTGLVVLVATPDSAADALTNRLVGRMKTFLWIPIVPGVLLLSVLVLRRRPLPRG
jgi:serine/threonine-protein kinase